jgi:hypothetical protein
MRISRFCFLVSSLLAVVAGTQPVAAQQSSGDAAPLKLERLEEVDTATAPKSSADIKTRITEERDRGYVTSIKVESGYGTYYLKPNTPAGSAVSDDARSSSTGAAQWQILEFDWKRQPEKAREAAAQAAIAAPPPAAAILKK